MVISWTPSSPRLRLPQSTFFRSNASLPVDSPPSESPPFNTPRARGQTFHSTTRHMGIRTQKSEKAARSSPIPRTPFYIRPCDHPNFQIALHTVPDILVLLPRPEFSDLFHHIIHTPTNLHFRGIACREGAVGRDPPYGHSHSRVKLYLEFCQPCHFRRQRKHTERRFCPL